jgi:quercetin dioxygenase-like cupin family protein
MNAAPGGSSVRFVTALGDHQQFGGTFTMRQHLTHFVTIAALAFVVAGAASHDVAGAATTQPTQATAIAKKILGQGASAVAPDRVLLLQERTFAPGSDSGAHPAPGPTVLYVNSGAVEFSVDKGAALVTRQGASNEETVSAGDQVDLGQGDAVFYDAGVVHDVANPNAAAAVTLEARLNPAEETPATPHP